MKVLASLTAKEKWDTLEKIHSGSEDVKQDRIAALTQDYNTMGEKEIGSRSIKFSNA